MKKLIGIVTIFLMMGCGMMQFKPGTEEIAIKISTKHFAFELANKNPELVKDGLRVCNEILKAEDDESYLFSVASLYLAKEIKNPVLRSDYKDLLDLVQVKGKIDLKQAKSAVHGFKAGLQLYKQTKKEIKEIKE